MDKAYSEFNVLQGKIQKLQGYLAQPHLKSIEYDELQETYFKLTQDSDEVKTRQISLWDENQRMSRILSDTEDKLAGSKFPKAAIAEKDSFPWRN